MNQSPTAHDYKLAKEALAQQIAGIESRRRDTEATRHRYFDGTDDSSLDMVLTHYENEIAERERAMLRLGDIGFQLRHLEEQEAAWATLKPQLDALQKADEPICRCGRS